MRLINTFTERVGSMVSWLTVAMVLVTALIVALRYVFNQGWIAMQESVAYLHSLVFMLGAAYTLKNDAHVRVDIFYQRSNAATRTWVDLLGFLFLLIPMCGCIIWASWDYTLASWSVGEASREAGGLPGLFLLKSLIPIMAILLLLQGLAQALRCILILSGRVSQPASNND